MAEFILRNHKPVRKSGSWGGPGEEKRLDAYFRRDFNAPMKRTLSQVQQQDLKDQVNLPVPMAGFSGPLTYASYGRKGILVVRQANGRLRSENLTQDDLMAAAV